MSDYQEFRPHPQLADSVATYCVLRRASPRAGSVQRIIPDGCLELNFNLGAPIMRTGVDDPAVKLHASYVVSRMTQPYFLQRTGSARVISVRFHPWGAQQFAGLPVSAMKDLCLPLDDLFGDRIRTLRNKIENSPNDAEAFQHLEIFLIGARRASRKSTVTFCYAAKKILETRGNSTVDALASLVGVSPRRLEQIFRTHLGISPKYYGRLIRFQHSLRLLKSRRQQSLTSIALEAGYFDQSHFIHDFTRFSGIVPGRFLAENHPLSDLMTQSLFQPRGPQTTDHKRQ